VLHYHRLKLDSRRIRALLSDIRKVCRLVQPSHTVTISRGESDNRFYECAEAGRADFLITGNTRHFPVNWGFGVEQTAARLLQHSAKARQEGEPYALRTAEWAAAAVGRNRAERSQACQVFVLSLTPARARSTLKAMEVDFTPDQKSFVRNAIQSGRLHREEDAVKEALSLWEERERRRLEILAAVELSKASLARGEGRTVTMREESDQLVSDVTRRGMARLAAEQNSRG